MHLFTCIYLCLADFFKRIEGSSNIHVKKLIFLFIKSALNWPKVKVKTFIFEVFEFLFQLNAVLSNFLFICECWKKCITVSTKIWSNNIDNNQKCFLSSKSFTFSHLADAFIQSDLQMRTIEAIKTSKRATTCRCQVC